MSIQGDTEQTGLCRKCRSQIPLEAERCPECGFEPKVGLLGKIGIWVSLMLGSTFLVIALSSLIVIVDGFPVTDALIVSGVTGFISLICFGYIYNKWEVYNQKPAIQPTELRSDNEEDVDWEKKGEKIGEKTVGVIHSIPNVAWSIGILVGILLGFAQWVLVGLEFESGFTIALVGGVVILSYSIMGDTRRLNRNTDLEFRWWFYTILGAIPAVGFIFGLVWLGRKKQKTGSAIG